MERYFQASRSTEPQFLHSHLESRSFCSSTPSYKQYGHQDQCVRSVIPQCHVQRQPRHHSLRTQSQSCRPMLIHNSFSENSFEYHPNQNSVSSHQKWKNLMQHRTDMNAKNCSMDLFQDSYFCNNQVQNTRPRLSKVVPLQPLPPGMMRVVEENVGDRIISTSDEEDSGENVSLTYPLSQNAASLSVQCDTMNTFVPESQALYSWIIKILPDNSGPCVEGKLNEEDDTYWHSSLVTERLESHLVQTVSGKVYQLMGGMDSEEALFGGFDEKTVKEFACGFPVHWREVVDQFFLRAATTSPTEQSNNDIDDGDVSLLDETLTPSKEKLNEAKPAVKSKENEKKVKKPKKMTPPKPVTRIRKKDRLEQDLPVHPAKGRPSTKKVKDLKKKKERETNPQSPSPSDDITELCTPTGKLIQLDSVKKTRSGRAVKPVLAWYAGQSVSVDPETNSYIVNHRTKFAESFLKDMTEFYKTRSHVSRKSTILNSSRISNTARPIKKTQQPASEEDKASRKSSKRSDSGDKQQKTGGKQEVKETGGKESKPGKKEVRKSQTLKSSKESEVLDSNAKKERLNSKSHSRKGRTAKEKKSEEDGKENDPEKDRRELSQSAWRKDEVTRFNLITKKLCQDDPDFWNKVVQYVKTRTLEECQSYFYKETSSRKKSTKPRRSKEPKEAEIGLTAKRGTLKRKKQLRDLVDHSNKLYQEDLFDGTPYRHHSKIPRLADDKDEDVFAELSKKNPHMMNKMFTPMTRINVAPVSTKKTPTSGLTSDPKISRNDADQYIHKMNIHRRKLVNKAKTSKEKVKDKVPVPNKKLFSKSDDIQSLFMQRCDSDSNHDDSGEDSDYYFSEEGDN